MANKPKDEKSGVSAIPSRVSKFVRDQKSEIKKIVWPGKKQVVNNTAVVIGFVLVAAVVVGVFDAALAAVVSLLLGS
ncbi:MAG TPA: preprotein translocase subunit SecE [Candidatus Fimivivens faecavium]|nr:preprotein translocase subunit SecE [Candidatus Fimivivens faecavium]